MTRSYFGFFILSIIAFQKFILNIFLILFAIDFIEKTICSSRKRENRSGIYLFAKAYFNE